MWFQDFSPYRDTLIVAGWPAEGPPENRDELFHWMGEGEGAFEDPEINIGWLDRGHEFPTGTLDPGVVEMLNHMCQSSRYLLERGYFPCGVCNGKPGFVSVNAQIRIQGEGVVYASPARLSHYIVKHNYLPPQAFVDAVRRSNGQQATPIVGKKRVVPPELLIPASNIDLNNVCERVRKYVHERFGSKIRDLSVVPQDRSVAVVVEWEFWPGGTYAIHRIVPPGAMLDEEKVFIGITSMIESAHGSPEASRVRGARPKVQ
jgi:hypothetical protein